MSPKTATGIAIAGVLISCMFPAARGLLSRLLVVIFGENSAWRYYRMTPLIPMLTLHVGLLVFLIVLYRRH